MLKNIKRISASIMALTLVAGLLAGCGTESSEAGKDMVTDSSDSYVYNAPTGVEAAEIFVEPVNGITDETIRGVDISTVIVQEESGVVYYNQKGEQEDLFKILADAGVNYVRVRVWNDPYDANGNGYGGGNCDVDKAVEIGRRAAEYNMKLLVDFHYSDFWADPSKQMCPKAWEGMSAEEKAAACYDFTLDAMNKILDGGADVGIVQLGNETNNGMSGETNWNNIGAIMVKGREAVLEAGTAYGNDNIKIAVHFTNPEKTDGIKGALRRFESLGLEYDIFALSYYPYWHGSLENLTSLMQYISDTYGKETMVVETSYEYTLEDGDGNGNSVGQKDLTKNYAATVQSQANAVRDIFQAVVDAGGLGVCYWEPAWIPVQVYDYTASNAAEVLASNKKIWEEKGSGWASSYAAEYDPDDAGVWYGGSAWDNQALFDHEGHALPSLYIFRYLQYGTTCDLKVDYANNFVLMLDPGSEPKLPETVEVHYNDRSKNGPASITWNQDELAKVNSKKVGEYNVTGTFDDGTQITCTVKVANVNWVQNPSFEDDDRSMWVFSTDGDRCTDFQQKETDAMTGEWAMHYWRKNAVQFTAEQTITNLENGKYSLSMYTQGGDSGSNAQMYLYAKTSGQEYKQTYAVDGWCEWKYVEIGEIEVTDGTVTIGVYFNGGEGAWGTLDDFNLSRID